MKGVSFLIVFIAGLVFIATIANAASLNIIDDFDKALKLSKIENKKAIIMFSDPSCYYCNKFKKETLKDETVVNLLKVNFIFSEIYPENSKKSSILGQELTYRELYGAFRISGTPTFWFFNESATPLTYLPGFVNAENFSKILRYMARDLYKKDIKFSDYVNQKDDFIGNKKIIEVKEEDFNWLLENDKEIVLIENLNELMNFDQFKKYAVESNDLAKQLLEKGAYNVFLKISSPNN